METEYNGGIQDELSICSGLNELLSEFPEKEVEKDDTSTTVTKKKKSEVSDTAFGDI